MYVPNVPLPDGAGVKVRAPTAKAVSGFPEPGSARTWSEPPTLLPSAGMSSFSERRKAMASGRILCSPGPSSRTATPEPVPSEAW